MCGALNMETLDSIHGPMLGKTTSHYRLDRFYVFKHQLQGFKSCHLCPVGFSDHCLLIGEVFISGVKPRSAYWHFNTVLLNDGHFRNNGG